MFAAEPAGVSPNVEEPRYLALLRAANAIATCTDCSSTSETLRTHLHEVTPFDFLQVVAFDAETRTPIWSVLEIHGKMVHGPVDELPVHGDSPVFSVYESGRPLLTKDWSQETCFREYQVFLTEAGIASTCTLPLTRGARRLGVMSVGRFYPHAYDDEEVRFLCLVADQIGLAVDASVNFRVSQRVQSQLKLISTSPTKWFPTWSSKTCCAPLPPAFVR